MSIASFGNDGSVAVGIGMTVAMWMLKDERQDSQVVLSLIVDKNKERRLFHKSQAPQQFTSHGLFTLHYVLCRNAVGRTCCHAVLRGNGGSSDGPKPHIALARLRQAEPSLVREARYQSTCILFCTVLRYRRTIGRSVRHLHMWAHSPALTCTSPWHGHHFVAMIQDHTVYRSMF